MKFLDQTRIHADGEDVRKQTSSAPVRANFNTLSANTSNSSGLTQLEILTLLFSDFDSIGCFAPKQKHRIEICRSLAPIPDSHRSPPLHEKGPSTSYQPPIQTIPPAYPGKAHIQNSNQIHRMKWAKILDCLICGKTTEQIRKKTVNNYLSNTVRIGETEKEEKTRADAFIARIKGYICFYTKWSVAGGCRWQQYVNVNAWNQTQALFQSTRCRQ